jgi:hypothetical protein
LFSVASPVVPAAEVDDVYAVDLWDVDAADAAFLRLPLEPWDWDAFFLGLGISLLLNSHSRTKSCAMN